jgi:hypothetical protein
MEGEKKTITSKWLRFVSPTVKFVMFSLHGLGDLLLPSAKSVWCAGYQAIMYS